MTSSPSLRTSLIPTSSGFGAPSVRLGPLSRYRPLCRLGRGGMAEVFLASWEVAPNVSRPVVIKRLHTHLSDDAIAGQMFVDEARLSCRLEHPNVVRTFEAGVIEGSCCIVMEYLEGQPLHRVLRRCCEQGSLSMGAAVTIALSVLDALSYAHAARDYQGNPLEIVHRDISPHNVFVTSDGVVKVLDFGIAKAKSHEGETATGLVKGKVGYIAPEQALAVEVDARTDLFATGVVLWEALTGSRLFKGANDVATLNLTLRGPISRPSEHRPEIPQELDAIVMRALERDPARRYASAEAMQRELRRFADATGLYADVGEMAALMGELFAEDLFEERRLVAGCLRESESVPPSASYRQPESTSAVVLSPPVLATASGVSRAVAEMRGGQRLASRIGLVALGLAIGFVAVLLPRYVRTAEAPASSAAKSVAATPQPVTPQPAVASVPPVAAAADAVAPAAVAEAAPQPPHYEAVPPRVKPAAARRSNKALVEDVYALDAGTHGSGVGFGLLTIDSVPWSTVSIDGKAYGQTPLVGVRLASGAHQLVLQNPELERKTSYSVTIEAGKTVSRRIGLEK
ncbi:MAG: serine/threonine-protein kinase [Polyangiaceae bacterium]